MNDNAKDDMMDQDSYDDLTPEHRGVPAWVLALLAGAALLLLCSGSAALVGLFHSGKVPAVAASSWGVSSPVSPTTTVTTTGTCEKKIIGEYGLIATITATNTGATPKTGQIWVRWPVTGEAAQVFSKEVTLTPGQSVEFPVNQSVTTERWYRIGDCSYGWTETALTTSPR